MKVETKFKYHTPVLLNEVLTHLEVEKNAWYIDATAGGGGHTEALLKQGGNVLALDQDREAVLFTQEHLEKYIATHQLRLRQGNFANIKNYVSQEKIGEVKGILFDLGMSTHQIKEEGRGFSFLRDEPLDMRMSQEIPVTAGDIVNTYSENELYEIFRKFGEENYAFELARAICHARSTKKINSTKELGDLVTEIYRKKGVYEKIHPATRVFQALRIKVNSELDNLRSVIPIAFGLLKSRGKLAIISFHSLEDRIVKQAYLEMIQTGQVAEVIKKPITASQEEIEINHAARSAKMRIIQRK